MGDGVTTPVATLEAPPESSMDFDYLDELFFDGCWLETDTNESDFLLMNTLSSSTPLFDSSSSWPTLESNGGGGRHSESQEATLNTLSISQDIMNQSESENNSVEAGEEVRRWWIGPRENPGPSSSVMERLIKALVYIKEFNKHKEDALIQIWVPVNRGGRRILRTSDLPFSLETRCPNLAKYREISEKYEFSGEEEWTGMAPGLPGRVYMGKVPEWTPDVRFFKSDEYPRVEHAQHYDVRGSLALPVFEQGSSTCLGVIELVMTNHHVKYRPQLETLCKALQAVDLRSSNLSSMQNVKGRNKWYEGAIPEIQEVLRSASEMHKLPLAQTWVPCLQQGKEGCRHSDDNYIHCISPVEHACYVGDRGVQGFHEACCEHHLLKGEGITGQAFLTNQPCFSADVTSLGKTEYPLSHHARMFKFRAAVAIRLRSIHTTTKDDFVLEFFLPLSCTDSNEQKNMLTSLSTIIQRVCHSLRVVTDEELEEEANSLVHEVIAPADSCRSASRMKVKQRGMVALLGTEEKSSQTMGRKFADPMQQQEGSILRGNLDLVGEFSTHGDSSLSSVGISKMGEKRRAKAEKTITPEVLRQHFAGSLKDAAKNIGVCTTTLKRICRQHGIKRWPSRKIKKVGHSLQKLQLVIDSVQGVSGAFEMDSFYSNFPKLASRNLSGTSLFSTCKLSDQKNPSSTQPEPELLSTEAAASKSPSSSSCSQSSISSHPCSSASEQHTLTRNVDPGDGNGVLKRVRSEAELKRLSQDRAKLFPRSQSQEALGNDTKTEYYLPLLKSSHNAAQKKDAYRVKITYGDEKARFRMPTNWLYEDLLQEIAKRFNINEISKFDIKYLDDDSEWVLLTCDADLEECIDVAQSSGSSTIKLCLQVSNHCMRRNRAPP